MAGASAVNVGEGGPALVYEEVDRAGEGVRERKVLPEVMESLAERGDMGDCGGSRKVPLRRGEVGTSDGIVGSDTIALFGDRFGDGVGDGSYMGGGTKLATTRRRPPLLLSLALP